MKTCSVHNCTNKYHAKAFCEKHYRHAKKHNGNPHRKIGNISVAGYHRIKINGKTYKTHRLVVEKAIGRKLLPTEIIHHIDGNKLNNSIENLLICTSPIAHKQFHKKQHIVDGKKQCLKCKKWLFVKTNFTYSNKEKRWGRWCKKCKRIYDHNRYLKSIG